MDYLDLMSTTGESYWDQKEKLARVRAALAPHVPAGARLAIRENEHDFGPYPSLVVWYDSEASKEVVERVFALEELCLKVAEEIGVDI